MQPGECYHLYPRCIYEAFADYQLPELLRTPLNSLCLQIKSLQVGSIGDFLSAALQPPEPLAVSNLLYVTVVFWVCKPRKVYQEHATTYSKTTFELKLLHLSI